MSRALTTSTDPGLPLTDEAHETYAFERALGYSMRESVRRAGGKPENGSGTKWESNPLIQARIKHLRGLDEEMLKAKRERIEQRLNIAAYFNILDFASLDDRGQIIAGSVDWRKLAQSEFGAVISEFRFDAETGTMLTFKRDDALAALAQLRDMHGFKAPGRTEISGKDGQPLMLDALVAASMGKKTEAA